MQNDLIPSVSFNYERDNREVKICPKGVLKLLRSLHTTVMWILLRLNF